MSIGVHWAEVWSPVWSPVWESGAFVTPPVAGIYGIFVAGEVIAKFVAPLSIRTNKPEFISDTLSLKRYGATGLAQRWEIESRLEPLVGTANDLFVDLVVKGHTEIVTIVVPQNFGVIQRRTSTSTPNGVGAAGSTLMTVSGNSGLIPKGTFFKFDEHDKVYMTTTNLSGDGTVGIYPPLLAAADSLFRHRDDVVMKCVYDTSVISGMQYTDGILMDVGTVKLVEKI